MHVHMTCYDLSVYHRAIMQLGCIWMHIDAYGHVRELQVKIINIQCIHDVIDANWSTHTYTHHVKNYPPSKIKLARERDRDRQTQYTQN